MICYWWLIIDLGRMCFRTITKAICVPLLIVLYSSISIAPINSRGPTEALLVRLVQVKGHVLRSDKDVERLDNKKETTEQDNLHVNRSSCTISMFLKPAIS